MNTKITISLFRFTIRHVTSFMFLSCLLILPLSVVSQAVQNYHVSPGGSDANDGTFAKPLQTIAEAVKRVKPGSTVFLLNGSYRTNSYLPIMNITVSGSANNYITFKPYPGHYPVISAGENAWEAAVINGSYIIIDGLEFIGDNAKLNLADAEKAFEDRKNNIKGAQGKFNTNALSIGKETQVRHVIIRNCKVHDFPAGGIGASNCDYLTVENNLVYNNSWYTMYATSGISIIYPNPIDSNTGYKIIVRGNTCYNNKTQVKWYSPNSVKTGVFRLSDGNGIIIDINNGEGGKPVYTGRTLVENNVSYNNGGSGIHSFKANHVDIINNTAYNNGNIVGYQEIFGSSGSDVKIYNNIMYARTGGDCNSNDATAVYNHNLYFNGPAYRKGDTDLIGNPQFVTLALNGTANFRLKDNSPAINTGSNTNGQFSTKDILNVARTFGGRSDRGAYEFQGTPAAGLTVTPAIQNIYKDALDSEWSDNVSYGGTRNLAYTTRVKEGSKSILFNYTNLYGGFSIARTNVLSTSNVASFKFWVYSTAVRTLKFKTQSDFTTGPSTEVTFTTDANAWKEITITRAQLGNPTIVKRIFFSADRFTGEVIFDDIRFIPVTPTITVPSNQVVASSTLEAEDALLSGTRFASGQPGNTGTGYVDYINPSTDFIEWTAVVEQAGTYNLKFRYALGGGTRNLQIRVNGTTVSESLAFTSTDSWATWGTVSITAVLNAGTNTIRATATGTSGPNMDNLVVEKASIAAKNAIASEEVTPILRTQDKLVIYPNPVKDILNVQFNSETGADTAVELVSITSQVVRSGSHKTAKGDNTITIDVSGLQSGIYFLRLNNGNGLQPSMKKIIIN